MANNSEFIEVVSPQALSQLEAVNAQILTMIKNIDIVNKNMINAKSPSTSDNAVKNLNDAFVKQTKIVADAEKEIAKYTKTAKEMERQSYKESVSRQSLSRQREKSIQQNEKEALALAKMENVYNKIQAKVNAMLPTYNNLQAKQQLGLTLSAKEEAQLRLLETRLVKYNDILKKTDINVGNHRREVGNYAKANSNLTMSIAQISRELPNFGQSFQIGVLSLTNNVGALLDGVKQVNAQNKILKAEGKPTTSAFKQVAAALFSWQTALFVGIGLLSAYSKEIVEFFKKLVSSGAQLQTIASQMSQLNDARKKSSELASKEISELDALYKTTQDVTLSLDQRRASVDKMQELYPNFLANISDENILNGKAEIQYNKLRDAIIAKYMAQAIGDKLAENAKDSLEEYLSLQEDIVATEKEINRLRATGKDLVIQGSAQEKTQTQVIKNSELILRQEELKLIQEKKLADFRKRQQTDNALLIKFQNQYLEQSKLLEKTENDVAKKKANKTKKEKIDLDKKEVSQLKELNKEYDDFLKTLKELQKVQDEINDDRNQTKQIKTDIDVQQQLAEFALIDEAADKAKKLKEQTEDFVESFKIDFIGNSGFSSVFSIINGELDNFGDNWQAKTELIMEATQEMFNYISELSRANFEEEYRRNEVQKNIALAFAGESAEARAAIEIKAEEDRKKIANREAKAKKEQAIFNIAIDTAQAIVAALPNIPLSIAIGAIGLAQGLLVASKEVPQYWQGTDNADAGYAWTQEKGAEIITDKHGNIKTFGTNKGAQLTKMDKGDKVFTASESKELMFNNEFNNILSSNGINIPKIEVNNGMTAHEMDKVLGKHFKSIKTHNTVFDKDGIQSYITKSGNKTIINSKRANGSGLTF